MQATQQNQDSSKEGNSKVDADQAAETVQATQQHQGNEQEGNKVDASQRAEKMQGGQQKQDSVTVKEGQPTKTAPKAKMGQRVQAAVFCV